MASKAKSFIALIMFWGVLGLVWAALNDTVTVTVPNSFTYAITDGATTWELLKYIWLIGMPLIAVGTGLAALSQRNQYSLGAALKANVLVLVIWFMTIIVWAAMYQMVNSQLPNAFTGFYDFSSMSWLKDAYNTGTVLFMVGMAVIGVSIEI